MPCTWCTLSCPIWVTDQGPLDVTVRVHLRWPSPRRIAIFLAATVAVFSVLAGLVLYANAIALHSDSGPTPSGDYVRLLVVDVTMWGPVVLITVWPVWAPVLVLSGVVAASLRRTSSHREPIRPCVKEQP